MADVVAPPAPTEAKILTPAEKEEVMQKAAKQVSFYFADANLPYDKFMWSLYNKTPEHWVPLSTITSFKRMREYVAALGGIPGVADAVRQHAPELKLNDAGDQVTRAAGPPKQEDNSVMGRSVYAKGFGEPTPTLQRELEEYFQQYGPTNVVRMRRDDRKKFKGSVFAEFKEPASVDKFLNADPKPTWKGAELLIMSKQAYCDMKIKEKGIDPSKAYNFNAFNKDGGNRDRRPKEKDANAMDEDAVVGRDIYLEFMSQRLAIKRDAAGEGCVDAAQLEYGDKQRGSTLKFSGVGGDMGPWSAVKDPIREAFARAPYIKFTREEDSGLVGFSAPLSEEDIEKVKTLLPKMNDKPVTWERAGEEEEKAFLIERVQAAAKSALASAAGRGRSDRDSGRGRGGGRGGRGRGRGRGEGRGRGRGGRGARGGRGGGARDVQMASPGGSPKNGDGDAAMKSGDATMKSEDAAAGEKRKRAVEPDGGPHVGQRGDETRAPPMVAASSTSSNKKARTDGE